MQSELENTRNEDEPAFDDQLEEFAWKAARLDEDMKAIKKRLDEVKSATQVYMQDTGVKYYLSASGARLLLSDETKVKLEVPKGWNSKDHEGGAV